MRLCKFPSSLPGLLLLAGLSLSFAARAQAPSAEQPGKVPVLQANSRLVVVDVVVADGKGLPIRGLKRESFHLLESGAPQSISSFEEHTAGAPAATAQPALPKLPPGVFTNYTPAPPDSAINILLLDSLNTPMADQAYVRDQMKKYLRTPRAGTRMAIFGLNQQLHMLQGLTADPEMLRAAIEGRKGLPRASPMMDNAVSGDKVGADTQYTAIEDTLSSVGGPGAAAMLANLQQFEAEQQSFQTMQRARYTLDALNALARYLSGIPGRKNLIWFSGSFPLDILPDSDLQDPFAAMADAEDEYRATINLLARSQVSVYPIDARGLMVQPMFEASNSGSKYARNTAAMGKDIQKFSQQTADEHSTMRRMAEDTGGRAFVNTNGLKEAVESAVNAGSNYYTLAYTPTNKQWKGEYRKIQVKLEGGDYALAYRRGYYADDPDATGSKGRTKVAAATAPTTGPAFNPMHQAMLWGSPEPTQIVFAARITPSTDSTEPAPATGTQAAPKVSGPYRRYAVVFNVSERDLVTITSAKGARHIEAEFLTFAYDDRGLMVTSTGNQIKAEVDDASWARMSKGGMLYRQEISVPASRTNLFLRLGIRDLQSEKVGAIEIPIDAVRGLKSLAAADMAGPKP